MIEPGYTIKLLDHGYVKYIGHMGSDETFIEAARMSTGKGFLGWFWEEDTYNDSVCLNCRTQHIQNTLPIDEEVNKPVCINCWHVDIFSITQLKKDFPGPNMPKELVEPKLAGRKGAPRDMALLNTLYANKHSTPFEMGELCIEVQAPIFVFREWHRHRTQSYNEFSGRYAAMPDIHYVPEPWRIQKQSTANKQGSAESLPANTANSVVEGMRLTQKETYSEYERYLEYGVAKEVARINTPVSRYSKMRAKTDIRNWLAFLLLRMDKAAQFEIRVYADAVASIIEKLYPRTYALFLEHDLLGKRLSATECDVLRRFFEIYCGKNGKQSTEDVFKMLGLEWDNTKDNWSDKKAKALLAKLLEDKRKAYGK